MKDFLIAAMLLSHVLSASCLAQESGSKFRGVCFSSVRDNESPGRHIHALPSALEKDVATVSRLAGAIRTYTVQSSSYLIPEFCDKYGIDCIVGAWIGPARWQNDAQMERLIHLASNGNPRIKAVIIGNEVLHRGDCTESQLVEYVRRASAEIDVPIAVADTWRAWIEHPIIAAEVDICGVQIYPYWEGLPIEGAAEYTLRRVRDVQNAYPEKRIVLTEFGWPTGGQSLGQAEASPVNAARYIREVIPLLEQNNIEYYYFSVWDENWKVGPEGGVGAHWGLFHSDGSVKSELAMLLPEQTRAGSKRLPRAIVFGLESDQKRNAELSKVALGDPDTDTATRGVTQRGPGLDSLLQRAGQSAYAGLRPLRQIEGDDGVDQQVAAAKQNDGEASVEREANDGRSSDRQLDHEQPDDRNDGDPAPGEAPAGRTASAATGTTPQPVGRVTEVAGGINSETESATDAKPAAADLDRPSLQSNQLHGVCLSLFRDNETPHLGITPLLSELRADLTYASGLAGAVRTYSVTDSFALVPEMCTEIGVDCFPGAALGKYPWLNDLELEMLIRIGQSNSPRVKAVIVGNEVMHRGDFSAAQYVQYIRRVKRAIDIPVATAELLHSWLEHPELAAEVDILGVQIYPYWGGLSIDHAAADTLQSVRRLQSRYPDKRVILTEFGWPTAGGRIGDAVASPENAARYFREVIPLLSESKIEYLYFAMTDETWKQRDEGGPGPHWGLLLSDGNVKPVFRSLLPDSAAAGLQRPPRKLAFED